MVSGIGDLSPFCNYIRYILDYFPVSQGVLSDCHVKCDAEPCKNGGICTENFAKQESYCNCEHTSFTGEFCMEEKGADFSGESSLQRKFTLGTNKVEQVKLQLAFSSGDLRRTSRVMLLLQTENDRSYYLMIGITPDGYVQFEEDREGYGMGAVIERNFLNNIRHSVYYHRDGNNSLLLIDRQEVVLEPVNVLELTPVADSGRNAAQIGGINTTDPRFAIFKSYSGCLSSELIQSLMEICAKIIVFFYTLDRYLHPSEQLFDETAGRVHVVYQEWG